MVCTGPIRSNLKPKNRVFVLGRDREVKRTIREKKQIISMWLLLVNLDQTLVKIYQGLFLTNGVGKKNQAVVGANCQWRLSDIQRVSDKSVLQCIHTILTRFSLGPVNRTFL